MQEDYYDTESLKLHHGFNISASWVDSFWETAGGKVKLVS